MTEDKKLTTRERQILFLEKYEELGAVWPACKAIGIKSRKTPYNWAAKNKAFSEAFDEVKLKVEDDISSGVILSAKGNKKLNADQLRAAIFMLKALNPHKYADKYQISGENGGPIEVDNDPKGKLVSALDRLAATSGTAEGNQQP